ncbi:MAG: hypothetical protein ABR538_06995 [Candidatus Binatia bacterium]
MNTNTARIPWSRTFGRAALAASASTLLVATIASASTGSVEPSLSQVTIPSASDFVDGTLPCTGTHMAVLGERRQRIADAPSVEEARDLAIAPARAARYALQVAGLMAPSGGKIAQARERLEGYEARVETSESPAAVAGEFGRLLDLDMRSGELMQVADLNVKNANVRGPGGCHYTTGEIVAVVFGFILFVIPGIILLVVLC